jgi:hypothetical protein
VRTGREVDVRVPQPRGAVSDTLRRVLAGKPHEIGALSERTAELAAGLDGDGDAVLSSEDLQLSLSMLYELHYRGFDGVDPAWEWSPELLAVRRVLERLLESALRAAVTVPDLPASTPSAVAAALTDLTSAETGPSLSAFLARHATADQVREFLTHRSIYHLKEADPHTWAIPRVAGRAKAALVEVQTDEYGGGCVERMHAALFARTLRALDVDDSYGAHLDRVPAVTLATVNAMSLFGLHRRLRGATLGHLAAFEMTSTVPNRRYGNALRRLGHGPDATLFFDEHVEADAVHEQIAAHDMCGALIEEEPHLAGDVLFGAAVAIDLERRFAEHVLAAWSAGTTSLRTARPAGAGSAA